MQKICANPWCRAKFEVTEKDLELLERISPQIKGVIYQIPPPTLCPRCRQQRRISWRNERNLYKRKCSLCKREHVSIYSPDKDLNVLCADCWWSDNWNALEFGQEYDFSRSFFDQFQDLIKKAGLISFFGRNNYNSEYVNQETDDKNCYMNAGGHYNEDCYYCTYSIWGKNNVDCFWALHSERCYECIHVDHCQNCTGCQDCQQCNDCLYCKECTGCQNCCGCYGLKHKEYYFFNEKLAPEDYKKRIDEIMGSNQKMELAALKSRQFFVKLPHRATRMINCENCVGNYLLECKDLEYGYIFETSRDVKYAYIGLDVKDSMDISSFGWGELDYEIGSSLENYNCAFLSSAIHNNNCYYCFTCQNSDHLFGCAGLKRQSHCILNKKYSREEYEELLPRIIEHMKKTACRGEVAGLAFEARLADASLAPQADRPALEPSGRSSENCTAYCDWGEFFPTSLSPWGYNETVASEYFPIAEKDAKTRGWNWKADDPREYQKQTYIIPDSIDDVSDDIIGTILACNQTGRNFRITSQELNFYREQRLPIPGYHPHTRHLNRLKLQNPWQVWPRKCSKCQKNILAAVNPDRPEIVYCEHCYLNLIY